MDYKDASHIKQRANTPRHSEHNAKGTSKNPFGKGNTKVELLARMKAATEARKAAK
jgi:hypothetical protein